MEFIGEKGLPAPLMQQLAPKDPEPTRDAILRGISGLYHRANLVHADLSEYNIMLWHGPVIIDISQAVLLAHPRSEEFLERDVHNILAYFRRFDIPQLSLEETIEKIRRGGFE